MNRRDTQHPGLPQTNAMPRANRQSFHSAGRQFGQGARYTLVKLLAVICITWFSISASVAQGRVALLLSAEGYQHFKTSRVTVAQHEALAQALRNQGFIVTLAANPGNATARAALVEFSRRASRADFALIVASGHFATYRSHSFFLPTNARIRQATDLFSRGLSVTSIADIAHRAKAGAFLLLTTVPDIPSTVEDIGSQPGIARALPDNVTVVFSTSNKVPVSRIDSVSVRAMENLIENAARKPLTLAALVDGASANGTGRIFGRVADTDLSRRPARPKPKQAIPAIVDTRRDAAEREQRQLAEDRIKQAEERARRAEMRARDAEAKAKRDLAAALRAAKRQAADARREAEEKAKREIAAIVAAAAVRKAEEVRQAEAARDAEAKRRAEAERQAAIAREALDKANAKRQAEATSQPPPSPTTASIQSLQLVEALLGRDQRRVIQQILKVKKYYDGPLDSVFGDGMREAIRAFQRDTGAAETGYLTPDQFRQLVASR